MIKFTFWVTCTSWATGGYFNTHYAKTEKEAMDRIKEWNDGYGREVVKLVHMEKVTANEFAEDYIGY